jgi:hypothetical protein
VLAPLSHEETMAVAIPIFAATWPGVRFFSIRFSFPLVETTPSLRQGYGMAGAKSGHTWLPGGSLVSFPAASLPSAF